MVCLPAVRSSWTTQNVTRSTLPMPRKIDLLLRVEFALRVVLLDKSDSVALALPLKKLVNPFTNLNQAKQTFFGDWISLQKLNVKIQETNYCKFIILIFMQ